MSSWAKSSPAGRRASSNPNGSAQQLRLLRRSAPYPGRGEERTDELKDVLDSYEELEQMQSVTFEAFKQKPNVPSLQPSAKAESCTPADRRKALYQKFYRQVQEERKPPDCVVLSVTNQCLDYPKSLSQCLQERGLSVEMLYLQAESGLTRALQDIRAGGSPLCILVEQTNVALSSCTVIIFSESLKIHRNMPKDQAMDFVTGEYNRGLLKERPPRDPADIAAQTSQLLDDFLDREKVERHSVPSETRQLLVLLAEGVHLYPEELETVSQYVRSRLEYIHASNTEGERGGLLLTPGQGKPPPLLPTPPGPPLCDLDEGSLMDHSQPSRPPLLPSPGFYPKTKPPSLLSLNHQMPCPPLAGPSFQGSFNGPPLLRGPPLLPHSSLYHSGPRGSSGMRGAPPLLKSSRPPLLLSPGPPPLRPSGPRH